jgi:Fe-S-cluster containining protein
VMGRGSGVWPSGDGNIVKIHLIAVDERRTFDGQLGRFTDGETIPCFRCGVCCRRWQPLVDRAEAGRLAAYLGVSTDAFLAEYTRPYPLQEDAHQLLEREGGCVFLRFTDGLAACSVHEARPQPCRDWDASLFRKECLDGFRGESSATGMLIPLTLYENPEEQRLFAERLRGTLPAGSEPSGA